MTRPKITKNFGARTQISEHTVQQMDALEVLVETYPQLLLYLYSYYVVSGYHTDNTDHDYTKIQEKFKTDETIAVGNGFFRLDPRFVFTIKIFIGVLLSSGCISTYSRLLHNVAMWSENPKKVLKTFLWT